jgi:hypothetical protein
MTTLTTLPTAPNRSMPQSVFTTTADAFLAALPPFVVQMNIVIGEMNANTASAAASAASASTSAATATAASNAALNSASTQGTSTTSTAIGLGSKTLTTQTGKNFLVGMFLVVFRTSDSTKYMVGQVTAYNSGSGSITINVIAKDAVGGTFTDWTLALTVDITRGYGILQPASASGATAAIVGFCYVFTATGTLTLPASPSAGNAVGFVNMSGTTTVSVARNGLKIMGLSEDMALNTTSARGTLVYIDATQGWVLFQ